MATKWGYREASKPVHRASVCGDFSLPRTLDACSPRSSGPVSEGGVFERRPPKIKGKETGSIIIIIVVVIVMYPYHREYERAGFFLFEIL